MEKKKKNSQVRAVPWENQHLGAGAGRKKSEKRGSRSAKKQKHLQSQVNGAFQEEMPTQGRSSEKDQD